jgi:hypothetical protein
VKADGGVVYVPTGSFAGHDQLTYRICAPTPDDDLCDESTLDLRVYPVAVGDLASTFAGESVLVDVLANDRGDVAPPSVVQQPAHGAVRTEVGRLRYTPTGSFTGRDTFTYLICSHPQGTGSAPDDPLCAQTTVTVTVLPLLAPDSATTPQDVPIDIDVMANDLGDAGPPLLSTLAFRSIPLPASAIGVAPSFGTATVLEDGRIRYAPRPGFIGADTFTYGRCSSNDSSLCSTTEVTVTVTPAETPTPTPTTTTPVPTDTGGGGETPTTGGGGGGPSQGGGGGEGGVADQPSFLPTTGGIALGAVLAGLLLLGGGGWMRRTARERRH